MVRKADSNRWTPGRCLLSPQFDMPPANMCVFPRGTRLVDVVAIMNQAALTADLCLSKVMKVVRADGLIPPANLNTRCSTKPIDDKGEEQ